MIFEKSFTTKIVCEVEEHGKVTAVKIGKESFFLSSKDYAGIILRHPKWNIVDVVTSLEKRYYYFTDKELKFIFKNIQYQSSLYLIYKAENRNVIELIQKSNFNEDNVLWFDSSCHLFYPVDSDMPMSIPIHVGYIEGVDNEYYDLDRAYKILKGDARVSEIKRIEIPYYNQDDATWAIEFKVLLSQKEYNSIVRLCRKQDPEYWMCHLKDHLFYKSYLKTDLLKLKPAYRGKPMGIDMRLSNK